MTPDDLKKEMDYMKDGNNPVVKIVSGLVKATILNSQDGHITPEHIAQHYAENSSCKQILTLIQAEKLALLERIQAHLVDKGWNEYCVSRTLFNEIKAEITSGEEQTKGETNEHSRDN